MEKTFRFECKSASDTGEFTGMGSVYGIVDSQDDVVMPGAFTKTIKEHGKSVPLLWSHKTSSPIGMVDLEDTPTGLCVESILTEAKLPTFKGPSLKLSQSYQLR